MPRQALFFSAIIVMVLTVSPTVVLAQLDPTVIEEYNEDEYRLEYTVVNPSDSSVDDIVGFVIEVDFDYYLSIVNENGWQSTSFGRWETPADKWDSLMLGGNSLTWRQFFGGMDYPFGDSPAAAYFVAYQETFPNTFEFDWSFGAPPYHLPILPGEKLNNFYAYVDGPASQYILAHIGDAENDTFDNTGLPSFQGEAIPEPATVLLFGLGGLGLIRRRRA